MSQVGDQYSAYIALSKYARWKEEEGRRETWAESVTRYMDFFKEKIGDKTYTDLRRAIHDKEVMPSMRALMTAGAALERDNVAGFNCSFLTISRQRAFDEMFYILMCGTGVGYSVERQYINKLPRVLDELYDTDTTIVVGDSKIGWSSAFRELISLLYSGKVPKWDVSKVRASGAPLKTFGGRASGPEPLEDLFRFTVETFRNSAGRKLNSIECHDICCKIGEAVVVGGVRRSACISLSNLTDDRMRRAKSGDWWLANPQRALANNSVAYTERPDIKAFMKEWSSLMESGSGERGIFNREGAQKKVYSGERRDPTKIDGTNPCVTGDTVIATLDGPKTFKELADAGEAVKVYSWHPKTKLPVVRWMTSPHKTREDVRVLEIEFDSGLRVKCTPDHNFFSFRGHKIAADALVVGQSVRAWSMSQHRDGHLRVHAWDSKTNSACHQWVHRMVWEDAVGEVPEDCVVHHKNHYPLDNSIGNLECITSYEHQSHHYPERFTNGFDGTCKNHKVVAVREAGSADVYNGCVDDSHSYIILDPAPVAGIQSGIVSANCGEILLRDRQFCNLSEVVVRSTDTFKDLQRKVKLATILGTLQATLTDFRYLSKKWEENTEEEALLGVSLTGIMDHPALSGRSFRHKTIKERLSSLKKVVIETNKEWSEKLGINPSAATTCVKPSGTVSQLVDSASGIHPRYSDYYIRTVRADEKDPLAKLMIDQGVPHERDVNQTSNWVFSFPIKSPEGSVFRNDRTAIEQLEHWKVYQENWCEHNPSITVYVKDDEWLEVGAWVYKHFDSVTGLTFLPHTNHTYRQAPYQEISESDYENALSAFPDIDWSVLGKYEKEDRTEGSMEYACSGGACEIV